MSTKEPHQYSRKNRYFYIHAATLACWFIAGPNFMDHPIGLLTKRPRKGKWHRVILEVIRTPKEQAKLDAKYKRIRERRAAQLKKELGFKSTLCPTH